MANHPAMMPSTNFGTINQMNVSAPIKEKSQFSVLLRDGVRIPLGLLLYIEFLNAGAAYLFLQFSYAISVAFRAWPTDKLAAIGAFCIGLFMTSCGLFEAMLFVLLPILAFNARRRARHRVTPNV